ncbi:inositol monophosphatase family protein [Aquibaculum arenosum]|uniref:Inositol-1-monophosphatase n=1 Tax=Aquibaculum arenosum TaxID=3032591 RepID=A0ABT5YP27_9PROT|nr:inositol monophosphatase family protein [Fodinicurvata sp. CAU 1616]MDF2096726.1 inositol monophosphatase family protein [Fodinicurvata sp. CAU 1616]
MSLKSPQITVMTRAAFKAARHLKRDFGEVENLQVSRKGPADFVSTADLKAEKILREELSRARPDYGFLMEESGASSAQNGETRRWLVDPLDGTTNFLHGLPHFAISIALEEKGEVIASVILDPIKDELFAAEKGQGAFLNDRRIRVSGRRRFDEGLFATGIPFKGRAGHKAFLEELEKVMAATAGVRRWGTAALDLAYVAAGRYEGFWERGLKSWDIAAGILLVREAGGQVSEIGGRAMTLDSGSILAANAQLHRDLGKLLNQPLD